MQTTRKFRRITYGILAITAMAVTMPAFAKPPAIDIAFILAGDHKPATQAGWKDKFPTRQSVIDWQIDQASLIMGGTLGPRNNRRVPILDYMYLQKLNTTPRYLELFLAADAQKQGRDYEDYFLHYREDSWAKPAKPPPIDRNPLFGAPPIAGYTNNALHAGFPLHHGTGNGADIFKAWRTEGALYVYSLERFDQLRITLRRPASATGTIILETPQTHRADGMVNAWQAVPSSSDTTEGLTRSGVISFVPPAIWPRAATHDGSGQSYGHGQFFADERLKNRGRYHVIRMRWQPAAPLGDRPLLEQVSLKPRITIEQDAFRINGFDVRNDINQDGYVDDEEFANRKNRKASARFRHEARLAPLNPPHSGAEGWVYANLMNPDLMDAVKRFYDITLPARGYRGAYNDEFFLRPSADAIGLIKGGTLSEYPSLTAEDKAFSIMFNQAFHNAFAHMQGKQGGTVLHTAANINHKSLLDRPQDIAFSEVLNSVMRENMLTVSTGLIGYSGLLMTGDIYALGPHMKTVVQAQARYGHVSQAGHSKHAWDKDLEALAAQAFLLHQPGSTLFSFWTASFWYGNGLTGKTDFHTAGIPRIMAYYPEALLHAPLGKPLGMPPKNKPAAPLFVRRSDSFTKIGTSTSEHLRIPLDAKTRTYANHPTGLYFAQTKGPWDGKTNLPAQAVVARQFENGIILFRTTRTGRDMAFLNAAPVTITLPRLMKRALPDGGFSAPQTSIELGGYEGAILLNAPE